MDEARALAGSSRGAMVAAAGCGKTHVISTAVAHHSGGRELVLTHTHAGVDALRSRLRRLGADSGDYSIYTIAGWSLRFANAFPMTTSVPSPVPATKEEYDAVYVAVARLLQSRPVKEIVRSSYTGVYVDEYQDCTVEQHGVILALAECLPCRVVGDPLQGIFGFRGSEVVRWKEHVEPVFSRIKGPEKAWRWVDTNPDLGEWLLRIRPTLESGGPIDLNAAPVDFQEIGNPGETAKRQLDRCFSLAKTSPGDTVVVICRWPTQMSKVTMKLKGMFSCVESIECPDLFHFAEKLDQETGFSRAVTLIDFAAICMTKISTELRTIRTALESSREPRVRKHKECAEALIALLKDDSAAAIATALKRLKEVPGARVFRRELLREMQRAIAAVVAQEAPNFRDAAAVVRTRTSFAGRVFPRFSVGTTHRVKGLEFDHAVILGVEGFDAKNLYVALSRASKSVTVFSNGPTVIPKAS